MNLLRGTLFLFLCLVLTSAWAQKVLEIRADDDLPRHWRGPHKLQQGSNAAATFLRELQGSMVAQGYLEASCDSCHRQADTLRCRFHLGPRYRWASLAAGNLPPEIASAIGFREKGYQGRPVTPRQVAKLQRDLLTRAENDGHPFALVRLVDIQSDTNGTLNATIHKELGRSVRIDSLVVHGSAKISRRYLYAHMGIAPGDRYNESLIAALGTRTKELPFVSATQPPYVAFGEDSTKLHLFLDNKKASSFNGVLGVQPDALSGAVRLTGDLDLKLRNAIGRGEAIDLNWRSLQDRTQDLRVGVNMPYLFNTPFGADAGLKLFKQDTTFMDVTTRLAVEYRMGRGDKLSLFLQNKSSKRLGRVLVNSAGLADVRITAYGLGLTRERLDYRQNPRRGSAFVLDGSVGRKRTDTRTMTDTIGNALRTLQYDVNALAVVHIPLGKRGTLRLAVQGGALFNDLLYMNEVHRIGGLRTMRGMDEASVYASSYSIGTIEYRFLFEENSNFFFFVDQGWWENTAASTYLSDDPIGFGAGTSFETKAGIFSLTYALGQQFNNPLDMRSGKIHFGFTSLF